MAQRVQVLFVDDYDGRPLDKKEAVRLPLHVDRDEYVLDLRPENVARLREAIAPFVANVTPTRQAKKTRRGRPKTTAVPASMLEVTDAGVEPGALSLPNASERRAMREWGKANGWPNLGDRGRLPAELVEAYSARNEQPVAAAQ